MNYIYGKANEKAGVVALALTMLIFCMFLSMQSAQGQGFKVTKLNVPGSNTSSTYALGVNSANAVVGYYVNSSGATVGFYYALGK